MAANNSYSKITPDIERLANKCSENTIATDLYTEYDVKRGLRDLNGKGVLAGLTRISEIISSKTVDGKTVPVDGELYYRGINVRDLIAGEKKSMHCGFEEATYLSLFGSLPNRTELADFRELLADSRSACRRISSEM